MESANTQPNQAQHPSSSGGGSLIGRASLAIQKELDIVMNILEENAAKMTEGEYLDAMNALCALHRAATSVVAPATALPPSSIWDDLPPLPPSCS